MDDTRFVRIELAGSGDQAVGFVEGLRVGMGCPEPVWFCGREEVDERGFWERLRHRLHMETGVITSERFAEELASAVEASPVVELEVTQIRSIDRAEMGFEFKVYNRDEGPRVRSVVETDIPDDVQLEAYEVDEEVDEGAKGAELYSPVHDYVLRGRGRYVGSVGGIIRMAHRLADQTFIHPSKIELHYES